MGTLFTALGAAAALAGTDIIPVHQGGARAVGLTGAQLLAYVGGTHLAKAGGTMTGALTLPAGAVGAPSLMFTGSAATTGIYTPAADQVAISISGTRRFMVSASNGVSLANTTIDNSGNITSGGSYIKQGSTAYVGWTGSADPTSAVTLSLYEDASDVLAQRRSTNAQTLRVYGTYTDSSNYERLSLSTTAGSSVNISAETLGTGGDNLDIILTPAGTGVVKLSAINDGSNFLRENLSGSGFGIGYFSSGLVIGPNNVPQLYIKANEVRASLTTAFSWSSAGWSAISDTALFRGAAGQVDVTNGTAATYRDLKLRNLLNVEYHQMTEMTAPSAPATNSVRIYAEDNGSGKTRLMALFATGAAQQIAIEP